ncbi:MAG: peptide-methionine (S)-S-oxide reductase MsrA [Flavobacteriaceae bacterium]
MKEKIYFASGCFWCTEAVFQRVKGVINTKPGYIDGLFKNPAYREVCTGRTGHAECIEIEFDTRKVSVTELLKINLATHDPTQLNAQGNDKGTQYRSAIYCTTNEQKLAAHELIEFVENEKLFLKPIVTEVKMATEFFEAELEHHNYYQENFEQPYCQWIINPKIEKLEKFFSSKID